MPSQQHKNIGVSTTEFKTVAQGQGNAKSTQRRHWKTEGNRKNLSKKWISSSVKRLKAEMAEIREDQKHIKEGQKEIRDKFEEIESDCNQLMVETKIIAHQSACNQLRLNLMFSILKARQEHNFALADYLTGCLREQTEKVNQAKASFR